jgi:hypothetical protein
MAKILTRWNQVRAGDIVSFRYLSGTTNKTLTHTLLVLAKPGRKSVGKSGKKYVVGLKLEESNRPTVVNTKMITDVLMKYGEVVVFDAKNKIFKLDFHKKANRRNLEAVYSKLKNKIKSLNIYRTYDFEKARKSQVFLESVKIDRELSKMLLEQYE